MNVDVGRATTRRAGEPCMSRAERVFQRLPRGTRVGVRARLDPACGCYTCGCARSRLCRAGTRDLMEDERGLLQIPSDSSVQGVQCEALLRQCVCAI